MYCGKCGNKIIDGDSFCRNCGAKVDSNTDVKIQDENDKSTVLDENNYTIAQKESGILITFKVIGLIALSEVTALMHFIGSPPAFLTASSVIIGFWVVILLIALSNKSLIGDCPYCKTKVKSANKAGFICPRCRKNVAVNGNKFMKIKD